MPKTIRPDQVLHTSIDLPLRKEMTWPFCPQCGNILEPPSGDHITCDFCSFSCKFVDLNTDEVVTVSGIRSKPAWLGDDLEDGTTTSSTREGAGGSSKGSEDIDGTSNKHATIQEPCPKCAHHEMYFYTMQLRSVDEGSTVFYSCPKCAHKFSVNN